MIRKYFKLTELVSKVVADKYKEQAWSFFDPRLFNVLIWIREGICLPMVINTATQQQRGLRENTCPMVAEKTKSGKLYLSAHVLGKGVDFNIAGNKLTAEQVRKWIRQHIAECPHPIRLEKDVNWVHVDVMNADSKTKLIEFKV